MPRLSRRSFVASTVAVTTALGVRSSGAQTSYPTRPIHVIVPYPAGGGTDYFARLVGPVMSARLGQALVIENQPGAGTIIGATSVARSAADGYTMLLGDNSTFAINKNLYRDLPYDPEKDFSPISLTGRFALVLLINVDRLNVSSISELVARAAEEPGRLDYASAGIGSPFHLAAEMFAQVANIRINHVPYKGAAPAVQDLMGGFVGMMFVDFATARGKLGIKSIKALAVASPTEFSGLPGVPTIAADYAGFEAWAWQGFVVPAGTPSEIIDKLREAYLHAINMPDIRQKLVEAGIDPLQSSPPEMKNYMQSETAKWGKVIKDAKIPLMN